MDVGIERSFIAQFVPDLPMPVCEEAIAKSKKSSEDKPGKSSQSKGDQIPSSQGFDHPPKQIEEDQTDVKDKGESIANF